MKPYLLLLIAVIVIAVVIGFFFVETFINKIGTKNLNAAIGTPISDISRLVEVCNKVPIGSTFKRNCNLCVCQKDGSFSCTLEACGNEPISFGLSSSMGQSGD